MAVIQSAPLILGDFGLYRSIGTVLGMKKPPPEMWAGGGIFMICQSIYLSILD